jgi:uncharacterized membrane protein YphA (DoxX/SURF4 family)
MSLLRLAPSEVLLRIAVAFAFLYPPIAALSDPISWFGYFPPLVTSIFHGVSSLPDVVLLHGFGIAEVVVAVWILFGRSVRTPAIIAAVVLFAIVGFNLDAANFSVLFRDVSIALAALALAMWDTRRSS